MRSLERALGIFCLVGVVFYTVYQVVLFYTNGAQSSSGLTITAYGYTVSLIGIAYASVVIFEAMFFPVGRYCWKSGNWLGAMICGLLLCTAILYTLFGDIEANVTGREDRSAERAAVVESRAGAKEEIERINKLRTSWTAKIRTARGDELDDLNDKVEKATNQIQALQEKMDHIGANAGAAPASKFLSDVTGLSEKFWSSFLIGLKSLFPALMRIFGLSLAIYALEMAYEEPKPIHNSLPRIWDEAREEPQQEPEEPKEDSAEKLAKNNIVPFSEPKVDHSDDESRVTVKEIVATAAKAMTPAEHPMPAIMSTVRTVAEARNALDLVPHKTTVGQILTGLGYPSRRGKKTEGRWMRYDFAARSSHDVPKATAAA